MAENGGTEKKLRPRQRRAIIALLTTPTIEAAAAAAKVGSRTIYRWLKQPVFQAGLKEAEAEAIDSLSRALVRLGDQATKTLSETMDDQGATRGVKVRAANIVLSRLLQLRELATLEARVQKLEEAVNERKS